MNRDTMERVMSLMKLHRELEWKMIQESLPDVPSVNVNQALWLLIGAGKLSLSTSSVVKYEHS